MRLQHGDVRDLLPGKLGSEHSSRVFPASAIQSEDSIAKDNFELFVAKPQGEVVELRAQDGLDILRITSAISQVACGSEEETVSLHLFIHFLKHLGHFTGLAPAQDLFSKPEAVEVIIQEWGRRSS